MLEHLPTNLPQYVLHAFATMSPQHHVVENYVSTAPILIDAANITGYQCVRGRSGAIAVLYETHWNGNPCAAWERKFTFTPSPTICSPTGRITKPTVTRPTENINDCVLTQPRTRSLAPNVKSTFRNLIHSSLALDNVLASYPLLYKLKPPVYINHFMVSGGLVKQTAIPCLGTLRRTVPRQSRPHPHQLPSICRNYSSPRPLGLLVPLNTRPHQSASRRLTWKTTSRFTSPCRRASSWRYHVYDQHCYVYLRQGL